VQAATIEKFTKVDWATMSLGKSTVVQHMQRGLVGKAPNKLGAKTKLDPCVHDVAASFTKHNYLCRLCLRLYGHGYLHTKFSIHLLILCGGIMAPTFKTRYPHPTPPTIQAGTNACRAPL
jgi:hypothetical protein